MMEFKSFGKIPRLSRDCVITEKIDGTNAQIYITSFICKDNEDLGNIRFDNGMVNYCPEIREFISDYSIAKYTVDNTDFYMFAGSRKRWITPEKDNYGFARWVRANSDELFQLGEGQHFGEWWGKGIQRNYGMEEKVFSLFNVGRWISDEKNRISDKQEVCPKCCRVVPVLYSGMFDTNIIYYVLSNLSNSGSSAAPGFMNPEGIIIYHTASRHMFKKTIENDEKPKGQSNG